MSRITAGQGLELVGQGFEMSFKTSKAVPLKQQGLVLLQALAPDPVPLLCIEFSLESLESQLRQGWDGGWGSMLPHSHMGTWVP